MDEIEETISCEGMIFIAHRWIPIDIEVEATKETEKAYFGDVTVYEEVDGSHMVLFEKSETWVPKSMAENPWWICTILFEHAGKVSNRRFESDGY